MATREPQHTQETHGRLNQTAMFACIFVVWLAFDCVVKRIVDSGEYAIGQLFAGPFLGLIDFRLVHNKGAAWGIFSESTFALGLFSLLICCIIVIYFIRQRKSISTIETIGLALLASGGIGNTIDRFVYGYVVDFIETTFIDFPVFNIADIGVTSGIVVFFIGAFLFSRQEEEC